MFEDILDRPIIREFLEEYSLEHWKEVIENVIVCGILHLRSKHPFSLSVNQLETLTKLSKCDYTLPIEGLESRRTLKPSIERVSTPLKIADYVPEPRLRTIKKPQRWESSFSESKEKQNSIMSIVDDIFQNPYMSMFMSPRKDKTINRRNPSVHYRDLTYTRIEEEKTPDQASYRNRQVSPDCTQSIASSDSFKTRSRLNLIKVNNPTAHKFKSKKTQFPPVTDEEMQYSMKEIDQLTALLRRKDSVIWELNSELSVQKDRIKALKSEIKENEFIAKKHEENVSDSRKAHDLIRSELAIVQAEVLEKDTKIELLSKQLESFKSSQLSSIVEEQSTDSAVDSLSAKIKELEMKVEAIPRLESQIYQKEAKISTLISEKYAKDSRIESLIKQVRELEKKTIDNNPTQMLKKFHVKAGETIVKKPEETGSNSFSELESVVNPRSLWLVSMEHKLRRTQERTDSQRSKYTRDNKSTVITTPPIHKKTPSRERQAKSVFQQFSSRLKS